jgi:hypothetical protein
VLEGKVGRYCIDNGGVSCLRGKVRSRASGFGMSPGGGGSGATPSETRRGRGDDGWKLAIDSEIEETMSLEDGQV